MGLPVTYVVLWYQFRDIPGPDCVWPLYEMIVPIQPCGLGCGSPGGGGAAPAVGAPTSTSASPATRAAIDPARSPVTAMTLRLVMRRPATRGRPSDPEAPSAISARVRP